MREAHAAGLLSRRAELTPKRVALVDLSTGGRQQWSYAELNERANRLANWLRRLGVEKGDRVSVLTYNTVVYIDLLFSLAKLGAIFAPLNWRLTARELAYIIDDCEPKAIFCGPAFTGLLEELRPQLQVKVPHYVGLEGAQARVPGALSYERETARASPEEPDRPELDAETPCCILYTSGTTGRPKGAVIPHRQVLWNCVNTAVSWGLTEEDVSPVFTPLFHAGGLFAFLTPLFYLGGRIVLSRTFEPEPSLRTIVEERCTVILGVPTIFKIWMEEPYFPEADFSQVRFFISGGAPLPIPLVKDWLAAKGGVLRQGYGLTEAGVNCFTMTDEESVRKLGSVGKPIFHSRMRIVDEQGRDLPAGAEGELLISGPHVFSGYWRNPQATAEALSHEPGGPWLHTGDIARKDEEGFYYIVGRFKDMIKSGGENIYAAEVEAVFREHPAVAEAALIGLPEEKWGEVGLMVVVLKQGAAATEEELLAFCEGRLARYKIPKRVVFTDALPYSPYGKVMKTALRKRFGR